MTREARDRPPGPFPRQLLAGDTLEAARALIGARLIANEDDPTGARRSGRIVEVEAYVGLDDRASHARMGPTLRNRVMFGPPGIAYVYLVYGMHHCLNVVTGPPSMPAAVLVRAVEPLEGLERMRSARLAVAAARRTARTGAARSRRVMDERLASGPGLVAAAFSIDRRYTGIDLCDPASAIHLEAAGPGEMPRDVIATPRVGVGYAGEPWATVLWRFIDPGSRSLSIPRG